MAKILTYRRWSYALHLFRRWLSNKFSAIKIDLTPVEEKVDEVSGKVDSIAADLNGVAQESTSQEILTAVENIDIDTSDLAKEATLNAVGLDAAAAKTAAQGITGYALQGSDATATNTAIAVLIGYTIQEIDGV